MYELDDTNQLSLRNLFKQMKDILHNGCLSVKQYKKTCCVTEEKDEKIILLGYSEEMLER